MKIELCKENPEASEWLPSKKPDGSGLGINFADKYIQPFNQTLEDGTKITCKRRGLKISVAVGEKKSDALLRWYENGPNVKKILGCALVEAFGNIGVGYQVENESIFLDV